MENLIREILDRGDGLIPSIGVGLAPLVVSDEDREGDEEADDGDNKEDSSDIHIGLLSYRPRLSAET